LGNSLDNTLGNSLVKLVYNLQLIATQGFLNAN
jgi:hypothetical protein